MDLAGIRIKERSFLARIAAMKLRSGRVAMVLGRTIHLHNVSSEEFLKETRWVKHELCHVQQFKKHGFVPFLAKYLWESIKHGYHNNKFEVEAREAELM
jgi:hypothetical protein